MTWLKSNLTSKRHSLFHEWCNFLDSLHEIPATFLDNLLLNPHPRGELKWCFARVGGRQASSQLGSADQLCGCRTRKKQKLKNHALVKIVFIGLGSRNLCTSQFLPLVFWLKPTKHYAIWTVFLSTPVPSWEEVRFGQSSSSKQKNLLVQSKATTSYSEIISSHGCYSSVRHSFG